MHLHHLIVLFLLIGTLAVGSQLLELPSAPVPPAQEPGRGPAAVASRVEVPEQVHAFLRNGQAWRAARLMREYLEGRRDPQPGAVLLAARAEAEWGGWQRVRDYLRDRPWLDRVEGGEGWYWLGRALEESSDWEPAQAAYARYLRAQRADTSGVHVPVAQLRRGLILMRLGRTREGTEQLAAARSHVSEVAPWIDLLAAESLAESGDTAGVRRLVAGLEGERGRRGRRARLQAYEQAGDRRGARALALQLRSEASGDGERAGLAYQAARLALEMGDSAQARGELRQLLREGPVTSSAVRDAALQLTRLGGLTADEQLRVARVFDRHGNRSRAISGYRAWLAAGEGSAEERNQVRFQLGSAQFAAGEYAAAESTLEPLVEVRAHGAEALHLIGRAKYRRGDAARAKATFLRLAERYPRTESASEGLFLVADLSHDAGDTGTARPIYRRVASEFPGTDRAGLSLMRLAGLAFQRGDYASAASAWEEYRVSYPQGVRWLEATYWAGRAHEAAGDQEAARARYAAVRSRDPLSYYALLAAERLQQPFWPIPLAAAPEENEAARRRVEEWMRGVDLLRSAGLHAEAEAEADRLIARAGDETALLYPLAETLIERGYTVRGIRIGLRLQRQADRVNGRLLRILYPFPYRPLVEAEARERGLDPFLVAALVRQESLFKARISSPVGARGLMQIMPETGRILAQAVGIGGWDAELLYQPEINVHLGTRYLAEQMRRYDGSLPSVFSAYNAGPHRIDRWKKFPEFGDEELFTERIPYRETRDYVKILTRNIALYRALYGD